MILFKPLMGQKRETVLNWLGRAEFAEFQKLLDILVDERFSQAKESETKDPMGYITKGRLTPASCGYLDEAMRIKICSQVLQDILSKKLELKTIHYAQAEADRKDTTED